MSLQGLTSLQIVGLTIGFPYLNTVLIAVTCAQFQKLKATISDIRQHHITLHHVQEDKQVHKIADYNLQGKLNACIRHHQEIME
jgi:hypothetical protein